MKRKDFQRVKNIIVTNKKKKANNLYIKNNKIYNNIIYNKEIFISESNKNNEINIENKKKNLIYVIKIYFIYIIIFLLIKKIKILKLKKIKIYLNKDINKLNNNLIYKIKKVVYSALLGNYDSIKQFKKQEEFDFFLFTDLYIKKETNWTILKIPKIIRNLNMTVKKKQRFIKLHPHLFFKNYDLSLYIDSSFIIFGNINEFLKRILTKNINIYVFEHPLRNCIYSEIKAVIKLKKEKKNIALKLRNKYKRIKFPKGLGLSENCLIVRRHNEKDCIVLMEGWWKKVNYYSYRDQLSFNYIKWKTKIKVKYISKRFALDYFKITEHLEENLKSKLYFYNTKNYV